MICLVINTFLLTKASSKSVTEASQANNEEAASAGQLGEPTTTDLLHYKAEGSKPVPIIWLLKKHVYGDGRAWFMACCGWAKIRLGYWEGS